MYKNKLNYSGGKKCCIENCKNKEYIRGLRINQPRTQFHRFPMNIKTATQLIPNISISDIQNYKNKRVCSEHFFAITDVPNKTIKRQVGPKHIVKEEIFHFSDTADYLNTIYINSGFDEEKNVSLMSDSKVKLEHNYFLKPLKCRQYSGGKKCCIKNCKNKEYSRGRRINQPKIKFHRFPKNIEKALQLIPDISTSDVQKYKNKRVCSEHFFAITDVISTTSKRQVGSKDIVKEEIFYFPDSADYLNTIYINNGCDEKNIGLLSSESKIKLEHNYFSKPSKYRGKKCCIKNCKNKEIPSRGRRINQPRIKFHRFPKNIERASTLIPNITFGDVQQYRNKWVCSKHFYANISTTSKRQVGPKNMVDEEIFYFPESAEYVNTIYLGSNSDEENISLIPNTKINLNRNELSNVKFTKITEVTEPFFENEKEHDHIYFSKHVKKLKSLDD